MTVVQATSTNTNVTALSQNTHDRPSVEMITAPSNGPKTRVNAFVAVVNEIALDNAEGGTTAGASACDTGTEIMNAQPRRNERAAIDAIVAVSVATIAPNAIAPMAWADCVASSKVRRSKRSAITPPHRLKSR